MRNRQILVLGGSGFVGTHLCARLVREGWSVKVLTRRAAAAPRLAVLPGVEMVNTDVHDPVALGEAVRGSWAVVNLVGILNESRRASFALVHAQLARKLVLACQSAGVERLVQVSALGVAPDAPSAYLRSKAAAEAALAEECGPVAWTVLRPSVIFGRDDDFVNRFARLLRLLPVFPLARAESRLAPVWIDDVVDACLKVLERPAVAGQRFELGGPEVLTLRAIVERIALGLDLKRLVVPLPTPLGALQAFLLGFWPGRPFTLDNFRSLSVDNVPREDGFARLGLVPVAFSTVLPSILAAGTTYAERERQRQRLAVPR